MSDTQGIAKRAVACKHWRWSEGMRTAGPLLVGDGYDELVVVVHDLAPHYADWSSGECHVAAVERPLPDLTNPATIGCLLALVREAWGTPSIYVASRHGGWAVRSAAFSTGLSVLDGVFSSTEAEALVAALEAAP